MFHDDEEYQTIDDLFSPQAMLKREYTFNAQEDVHTADYKDG